MMVNFTNKEELKAYLIDLLQLFIEDYRGGKKLPEDWSSREFNDLSFDKDRFNEFFELIISGIAIDNKFRTYIYNVYDDNVKNSRKNSFKNIIKAFLISDEIKFVFFRQQLDSLISDNDKIKLSLDELLRNKNHLENKINILNEENIELKAKLKKFNEAEIV